MSTSNTQGSNRVARGFVYAVLLLACLFYLLPLFVMLSTSLKSLDEIRAGNLLSLPKSLNFDAWAKAWGTACTGVQCEGLKGYLWNSVRFTKTDQDAPPLAVGRNERSWGGLDAHAKMKGRIK